MVRESAGLVPGDSWGHLTIRRDLGPGPRGLVYRAWDPALGHEVVLAIAPDVHTDPLGRDTLRDARLLAKVRHDNLAIVYGAARRQGRAGVWLEPVDGETLETALKHVGRFSAREAALIGVDVCAALSTMHAAGVLHGDLGTRQVVRDRYGRIVVIPFGAARDAGVPVNAALLWPFDEPLAAGQEPEIAAGGGARVESDVYRVGALLHRLVTGVTPAGAPRRPLADERSDLPIGFIHAVERALALDPAERHPTAADLGAALMSLWMPMTPHAVAAVDRRRPMRVLAGAAMAAVVVTIGMGLGAWLSRQAPPAEVRFDIQPEGDQVESVAFSRDGRRVAYVSGGRLRLRSIDDDASAALEPPLGVRNPFFSSDGQWVHFFGGTSLWRVAVSGGEPQFVAPARRPSTGASGPDGSLVYSVENGSSLMLLPPAGVARVVRVQVPGARTVLQWPSLVGNGEYLLYSAINAASGRRALYVGRVTDPPDAADRTILDLASNAVVTASHVFYVEAGALTARRLDPRAGRFVGEARILARGIVTDPYGDGQVELSASDTGAVVYVGRMPSTRTLRMVDDDGHALVDLATGDVRDLRVSPDGARVAYEQVDPATGGRDIWVVDTRAGSPVRISRHPAHDIAPTWSPDGERLFYLSQRGPQPVLVSASASGAGAEQVHFAFDGPAVPYQIIRDGQVLLYQQEAQDTGWDIWMRPLAGGAAAPLVRGRANEQAPALSPDGRWLAYSSPESDGRQVYVERVPNSGRRWRVSTEHGRQPQWQADSTALYYHGHDRQLIRMPIDVGGATPVMGIADVLFPIPLRGYDARYQYGVAPDGSRVVVNVPPALAPPLPATVILNAPLP